MKLSVLLREDYSRDLIPALRRCSRNPKICVLRFVRIVRAGDRWMAMTVHDYSKILLEPRLPEVERLREKIILPKLAGR